MQDGAVVHLECKLHFSDEKTALAATRSVAVELGERHERRSVAQINTNKNIVLLKISALDKGALKASMNSYLKLLVFSQSLSEVS